MYRTDWFRFQVQVSHGEVLRLEPVNIAARRVQTLDDEEAQQEMVEDVVKANAAGA
jgi:ribosomal protein S3AE